MADLGGRLRAARHELGLTMVDVAERVGVHYQSVFRWETGKQEPDLARLKGLASVLGKPVEWFKGVGVDESDDSEQLRRRARQSLDVIGEALEGLGLGLKYSLSLIGPRGDGLERVAPLDVGSGDLAVVFDVGGFGVEREALVAIRAARVRGGLLTGMPDVAWNVVVDIGRRDLKDGGVFLLEAAGIRSLVSVSLAVDWVVRRVGYGGLVEIGEFDKSVWGEVVWLGAGVGPGVVGEKV